MALTSISIFLEENTSRGEWEGSWGREEDIFVSMGPTHRVPRLQQGCRRLMTSCEAKGPRLEPLAQGARKREQHRYFKTLTQVACVLSAALCWVLPRNPLQDPHVLSARLLARTYLEQKQEELQLQPPEQKPQSQKVKMKMQRIMS